jgi:apolipoprotein N-acyltransferase
LANSFPRFFRGSLDMMNIPLGEFNRGRLGAAVVRWQGPALAPNICYEDLFGEELGARFADAGRAPTLFVNVSNIGWFGDSVAIDQHLQISRMRALEFERPMLRATNTGPRSSSTTGRGHRQPAAAHPRRAHRRGAGPQGNTPFATVGGAPGAVAVLWALPRSC